MKVLIVDDSLMVLKAVESQIKEISQIDEVILCSQPTQTINIIKNKNIDILIMDVVMPEISGLEVLAKIRKDEALNDIQVIMLTSEPEYLKESFSLGSDDFINKPFKPVELQSRLKAAIKNRKSIMMVNEMNNQLYAKNEELLKLNHLIKETQVSIIQTEKMASIGELAAGVAHEINNPLGYVKSNIETLNSFLNKMSALIAIYRQSKDVFADSMDGPHEDAFREHIKSIIEAEKKYKIDFIISELEPLFCDLQEGIARVVKIVSTLTSFAHTSMDGDHVLNSISDIIEESLLIIKNEYKYSINIHTLLDKDDEVYCNKGQIEQVIINILMNAIQAIKHQKGKDRGNITISTKHMGVDFQIIIEDDGPGVPEDLFSRIFDPFFTTKDIGQGTGLGLSISYDIVVNKHGGSIAVSNHMPSGAVFKILLPVSRAQDKEVVNRRQA